MGQYGAYILHHAALAGLICHGQPQGKQDTYTLLDDWLPPETILSREEALTELAGRYFCSHGPATLHDFASWASLPVGVTRTGLEGTQASLVEDIIDGNLYWRSQTDMPVPVPSPTAYLLPGFDEYYLGYKDRSAVLGSQYTSQMMTSNGIFRPTIVIDGQVVGIWQRTIKKREAVVNLAPFEELTEQGDKVVRAATHRYGAFLELPVTLHFPGSG